eukprot:TRINITY_DN4081_c0_g1_i2.p1 TRINITY_DN4081_c0_g1~~TRINITY_DN4081_c0_g1_i2.p1  ORF type:complete len:185 (+),score=-5.82 TRINITY_DN4081_c0_g1_i2:50-604(+)
MIRIEHKANAHLELTNNLIYVSECKKYIYTITYVLNVSQFITNFSNSKSYLTKKFPISDSKIHQKLNPILNSSISHSYAHTVYLSAQKPKLLVHNKNHTHANNQTNPIQQQKPFNKENQKTSCKKDPTNNCQERKKYCATSLKEMTPSNFRVSASTTIIRRTDGIDKRSNTVRRESNNESNKQQ